MNQVVYIPSPELQHLAPLFSVLGAVVYATDSTDRMVHGFFDHVRIEAGFPAAMAFAVVLMKHCNALQLTNAA